MQVSQSNWLDELIIGYNIAMIVLIVVLLMTLLMVASIRPYRSELSDFELQRRCEEQDDEALLNWRRQELFADVTTLRRLLEMTLVVLIVSLLAVEYGLVVGMLSGIVVAVTYPALAWLALVRALPQIVYRRYELWVLDTVESIRGFTKLLRRRSDEREVSQAAASRQELQRIIELSSDVMQPDERKVITGAFDYADKLVKDYMTPRSQMEVIGAHEMLGPLVLDDLHKTGHSHFPVLDGDIDHIVGMLHLHNLLTLTKKETMMVKDVMEPKVLYIHEDQTLDEALSTCIKHRRHLLVVVNDSEDTVGVITIEDAVEQLIGREIVDTNDDHDSLMSVAKRKN